MDPHSELFEARAMLAGLRKVAGEARRLELEGFELAMLLEPVEARIERALALLEAPEDVPGAGRVSAQH